MGRPYSLDLRERVVAAVERSGISRRRAAAQFGVGVSTSIHWVRRLRETGSISPGKMGGHKPKAIAGEHRGDSWPTWPTIVSLRYPGQCAITSALFLSERNFHYNLRGASVFELMDVTGHKSGHRRTNFGRSRKAAMGLNAIEKSDLTPKAKLMAQMLWISRNFLRELPAEPGPLQKWSVEDIILATRHFMEDR
jgi:'Paired box' domain